MSIIKEFVNKFTSNSTRKDIKELETKTLDWLEKNNCNDSENINYSLFGNKKNYSEFKPGNICLFVHLYKPIRKLGSISKAPKSIKIKGMPVDLQYCIMPVIFDINYPLSCKISDRKPINIVTKKRGLWLIVNMYMDLEEN